MEKSNYLDQIRKNWIIIVFLVGTVVSWTSVKGDAADNKKDIESLKADKVSLENKIENYRKEVADVAGDIKAIKESLSFIREKIK